MSVEYVDATPTWQAIVPVMLEAYAYGDLKRRAEIRREFMRIAKALDDQNDRNNEQPHQ
jgi:hypothetical protein